MTGVGLGCSLLAMSGCKSKYVAATVHNGSTETVHVLEVDYPSASFGTETLAPGADFHYRFKIQGDGNLKASWTDAQQHEVVVNGPKLNEGDEGSVLVTLHDGTADWAVHVKP